MYGEIHANLVLYKTAPGISAGRRFRQIAVVEKNQFEVHLFEGDVVQLDPKFIAQASDAEVHFHPDLKSALKDANEEFQQSIENGWRPYDPHNPPF